MGRFLVCFFVFLKAITIFGPISYRAENQEENHKKNIIFFIRRKYGGNSSKKLEILYYNTSHKMSLESCIIPYFIYINIYTHL